MPQGVGGAIFQARSGRHAQTLIKQGCRAQRRRLSPKEDRLYVVNGGALGPRRKRRASTTATFRSSRRPGHRLRRQRLHLGRSDPRSDRDEIGQFTGGTNLAFGGPDGKTLFVVGGDTDVKVVQTNLPGLP